MINRTSIFIWKPRNQQFAMYVTIFQENISAFANSLEIKGGSQNPDKDDNSNSQLDSGLNILESESW